MTPGRSAQRVARHLARACAWAATTVAVACVPARAPAPTLPGAPPRLLPATVRIGLIDEQPGAVERVPIEDYVLASILTEVAPARAEAAALERFFEVQAIVARTYAAANPARHASEGFDLCATTHCQLVDLRRPATSSWTPQAARAVARTAGVILVHDGRPAQTVFHADCGGHTSAALDVWGGAPRPYLRAVPDDLPAGGRHQTWRFEVTTADLAAALNRHPRTSVGTRLRALEIVERDKAGRILRMRLRGARDLMLRGDDFRTAMTRAFGARALRSAWFDVRRLQDRYVFEGRGFGHGVGLCQIGAQVRAATGVSALAILDHFYPGTHPAAAPASVDRPAGRPPSNRHVEPRIMDGRIASR